MVDVPIVRVILEFSVGIVSVLTIILGGYGSIEVIDFIYKDIVRNKGKILGFVIIVLLSFFVSVTVITAIGRFVIQVLNADLPKGL